ncbi:MAG: glutamate 5-kinase [Alphaproteobacteria bacterium]|nr:glutamate 5-kinase [Alphaproteobacteria bacterium]MBP9867573.1 glutamate 5-kinase [Alphaproteobacteria bacterium]
MSHMTPQAILGSSQRIVLKIGTETIIKNGSVHTEWLNSFAEGIAALKQRGKEVIVVTSGAIGLGRGKLDIDPTVATKDLPMPVRQQAAMVGQTSLMLAFSQALERQDLLVGQVLLTADVTEHFEQVANLRNACLSSLDKSLSPRVIPVVNENDTIATSEIAYGDNDRLGAIVANLLDADTFVLFSDVDGLYNDNPKRNPAARFIPHVEHLGIVWQYANDDLDGISRGGMMSKLRAIEHATLQRRSYVSGKPPFKQGATSIIAKGKDSIGCLQALMSSDGEETTRCTVFIAPLPVPTLPCF